MYVAGSIPLIYTIGVNTTILLLEFFRLTVNCFVQYKAVFFFRTNNSADHYFIFRTSLYKVLGLYNLNEFLLQVRHAKTAVILIGPHQFSYLYPPGH